MLVKLNIGYYPLLDMFLALRQEYSSEKFRPFNREMTIVEDKFTSEEIRFIDQFGVLTNGYLSTLHELLNAHSNNYSSPESILIELISSPGNMLVERKNRTSEKYDDNMKSNITSNLVNLWKDIFSDSYSKYSKEIFDKVMDIKSMVKDNEPLNYLCGVSDRVYMKDNKLHFNIEPSFFVELKDIDHIVIMPSIFASRDLTFWYSSKNIIFFLRIETKQLKDCDPPEVLLSGTTAFNDKTRLKMLRYMLNENCSAAELADYIQVSIPTILRNLKLLKDSGFVEVVSEDGEEVIYSVNKTKINGALILLRDYLNIC